MLTKRLTKIGDSTGLVIDKPILDLLGLARGDEVELKVENERLIVGSGRPIAAWRAPPRQVRQGEGPCARKRGRALRKLAK
jgi:hypothetical protein